MARRLSAVLRGQVRHPVEVQKHVQTLVFRLRCQLVGNRKQVPPQKVSLQAARLFAIADALGEPKLDTIPHELIMAGLNPDDDIATTALEESASSIAVGQAEVLAQSPAVQGQVGLLSSAVLERAQPLRRP